MLGTIVLAIFLTLMGSFPVLAADEISGQIQGFNCLVAGTKCPSDNMDPHLMLESDFVLLLANSDYYLLPNLSRAVKAKYLGKNVKVTGKTNDKYRAIMVEVLKVEARNDFKTVWSAKMMREEMMRRLVEFYPEH